MKRFFCLSICLLAFAAACSAQKITIAGLRVGAFYKGTEVVAALGNAVGVSTSRGRADLDGDGKVSPTYTFTFANGCRVTFLDGGYLAAFNVPCKGVEVAINDAPFSVGQHCGLFLVSCDDVSYDGENYSNRFGAVTLTVKKTSSRTIANITCSLN